MSDLKSVLIRLGSANPELQPHLRPVIDHITASGDELAKIRTSLQMTIGYLRDELREEVMEARSALAFAQNLEADAARIEPYNASLARSIRVTAKDIKTDVARRGEVSRRDLGYYIENLKADLSRL